jgi:hypothetical protein
MTKMEMIKSNETMVKALTTPLNVYSKEAYNYDASFGVGLENGLRMLFGKPIHIGKQNEIDLTVNRIRIEVKQNGGRLNKSYCKGNSKILYLACVDMSKSILHQSFGGCMDRVSFLEKCEEFGFIKHNSRHTSGATTPQLQSRYNYKSNTWISKKKTSALIKYIRANGCTIRDLWLDFINNMSDDEFEKYIDTVTKNYIKFINE